MFKKILPHVFIGCAMGAISGYVTFNNIFNLEAVAAFFWWFYIVCAILVIIFKEYAAPKLASSSDSVRISMLQKKMLKTKELYDANILTQEEYDEQIRDLKLDVKNISK